MNYIRARKEGKNPHNPSYPLAEGTKVMISGEGEDNQDADIKATVSCSHQCTHRQDAIILDTFVVREDGKEGLRCNKCYCTGTWLVCPTRSYIAAALNDQVYKKSEEISEDFDKATRDITDIQAR